MFPLTDLKQKTIIQTAADKFFRCYRHTDAARQVAGHLDFKPDFRAEHEAFQAVNQQLWRKRRQYEQEMAILNPNDIK